MIFNRDSKGIQRGSKRVKESQRESKSVKGSQRDLKGFKGSQKDSRGVKGIQREEILSVSKIIQKVINFDQTWFKVDRSTLD